jgi:hypothetical protein
VGTQWYPCLTVWHPAAVTFSKCQKPTKGHKPGSSFSKSTKQRWEVLPPVFDCGNFEKITHCHSLCAYRFVSLCRLPAPARQQGPCGRHQCSSAEEIHDIAPPRPTAITHSSPTSCSTSLDLLSSNSGSQPLGIRDPAAARAPLRSSRASAASTSPVMVAAAVVKCHHGGCWRAPPAVGSWANPTASPSEPSPVCRVRWPRWSASATLTPAVAADELHPAHLSLHGRELEFSRPPSPSHLHGHQAQNPMSKPQCFDSSHPNLPHLILELPNLLVGKDDLLHAGNHWASICLCPSPLTAEGARVRVLGICVGYMVR